MRKIYLLALLFISSSVFGQLVFDEASDGIVFAEGNPDDSFIDVKAHVTNTGTSPVEVAWRRTTIEEDCFTSQICDGNQCYLTWIDESPVGFTIAAGATMELKAQFAPAGSEGCCSIEMEAYDINNPENTAGTLIYRAKAGEVECDASVGIEDENLLSLSLYPNPVITTLNVDIENYSAASFIDVYNLTGKLLQRVVVEDEKIAIDAMDWTEGMYILSVLDNDERPIETRRFSKVR